MQTLSTRISDFEENCGSSLFYIPAAAKAAINKAIVMLILFKMYFGYILIEDCQQNVDSDDFGKTLRLYAFKDIKSKFQTLGLPKSIVVYFFLIIALK